MQASPHASVIIWLRICIVLILCMVVVGGLTRLTESGLSIVEWKLVTGTFPPLNEQAWEEEFRLYQATPEFIKEHHFMTLEDFKGIFWLEYLHRLLGRVIGLAFLLPLMWFQARRILPKPFAMQMWGVFALVCLQGVVGWYMVKSGLVRDPWVSPYRLAFHLTLATVILARTYWLYLSYSSKRHSPLEGESKYDSVLVGGNATCVTPHNSATRALLVLALIFLQIAYGAFVAGLDAGLTYNTFPLMDGQFLPPDAWRMTPWFHNLFEHIPTVQFIHRWLAFGVLAAIYWQWLQHYDRAALWVAGIATVQVVLGVATLLSVVAIALASLHQFVAMLLVLAQLRYMWWHYHKKVDNP
jgi:heme a synthase